MSLILLFHHFYPLNEVFTLPLVFRPESGWSPGIPPD
jgi:hypothetical protein